MITEIPYYKTYEDFTNKKYLGVLTQLKKVEITEKGNNSFVLNATAVGQTKAIGQLLCRRILGVVTDSKRGEQAFVIKRWSTNLQGQVEIYAEHIAMSLCEITLKSGRLKNQSATYALSQLKDLFVKSRYDQLPEKFFFRSDVKAATELETQISPDAFDNAFQALMGARGSVLDVWGGEYIFDNTVIDLRNARGRKSIVPIKQGENLIDFEYEQSSIDNYDAVNGYVLIERNGIKTSYYGTNAPYRVVPNVRELDQVLSVDFTEQIPEDLKKNLSGDNYDPYISKVEVMLNELNQNYARANRERFNSYEHETIQIKPSYNVQQGVDLIDEWAVFNTVTIDLPMVNYTGEAKIVETVIDLIQGKLTSITLGKPKRTII